MPSTSAGGAAPALAEGCVVTDPMLQVDDGGLKTLVAHPAATEG